STTGRIRRKWTYSAQQPICVLRAGPCRRTSRRESLVRPDHSLSERGGRTGFARGRCGGFNLSGQDIPVLIAERHRDQLQRFAMSNFDAFCLQGIAQRTGHELRIAEIAHGSTSSSGERMRSEPALPTRSPNGEGAKEVDTFTIP